ncbi:hypothetical protein L3Q82_013459 [Scortum barcoo]|uniref:Uncharacterized protein n=1 Tax=Scortum barcoo TaxID=214431 RepID=A0ACB8W0G0_9TELE|nr:hypothetical protein L3Q82_013459 [Scortum barcoo]
MFSASIVDASSSSKLWTQGFWCLSWRQPPNPVVDTGSTGRPSEAAARAVLEAKQKLGSGRSSVRPWRRTIYRSASKRFWQTVRRLRRGKQYYANTVYSAGGELLTSTGDIVGRWKKYFEDLLNPTDLPSNEEAEAGDSEVDSSITQAEVTEGDHTSQPPREGLPARVLERRIRPIESNPWIQEEQCGFRPGRVEHWTSSIPSTGCLRVYGSLPNQSTCALWIWRRHSDRVPRGILWGVLREYGVRGPLLRAVRSLYDRSRSLVRIAGSKSDLFPVHVGLRQGLPFARTFSMYWSGLQPSVKQAGMRISTSKSEAMVLDSEKGGVPSPGGWRGPASSGGVQVSRGLVHE